MAAALAAVLVMWRPPRIRYAAACLAMLGMLLAFSLTLVEVGAPNARGLRPAITRAFPARSAPDGIDAGKRSSPGLSSAVPWLAPLWMAGVWISCLGHVAGWIAVCRLRRRGVCHAPECWQDGLTRLARRLRLSRPVVLLESCFADAPMVIGHLRPVILMPIGVLAGLPAGQIDAILLHELAHVRRCDYLVNVLQRAVLGLFFYHPAAWWISRVIHAERENCCDDIAVGITGNAHAYAAALTTLEQNRCCDREPAVAATGGSLMKRIRRLLYPKAPISAWTPLFATGILIATATVTLLGWQAAPPQNPAAAPPLTDAGGNSPYEKWLNQDVLYLITDRERAAFQKLTSDEERSEFIRQFWLRRDPTPGTPENEFKVEHYRRIAYANQHFGATNLGGWKTDRGRIYIVWGPPDEIESHPSGGAYERPQADGGGVTSTFPFEAWRYRYVEGMGNNIILEFVEKTGTGEFRMAMDRQEKEIAPDIAGQPGSRQPSSPLAIFVSREPGSKVTVKITSDRRMLLSIPIDFDAKQYSITGTAREFAGRTSPLEFRAVVSLCKNLPGAPGCLGRPVYQPDASALGRAALEPGSYILNVTVKDLAGVIEKTYTVQYDVN
jgi:GWxTD domain-containing protein